MRLRGAAHSARLPSIHVYTIYLCTGSYDKPETEHETHIRVRESYIIVPLGQFGTHIPSYTAP